MAVWLLAAISAQSGTPGVDIPPTSLLNATSVLPSPACQPHRRYKRNHVCVRLTLV